MTPIHRQFAWVGSCWAAALFGLAVSILTWKPVTAIPVMGLDPSWILGLNLAAASGLDHGTEFVFTYGPLGFLDEAMVIDGLLATLGGIYLLATRAALAASLFWAARRSFPPVPAAALALVATAIVPRGIVPLALATIWCMVALQESAPRWAARVIVVGGGALAALEVLVKLNVGVTILALVGVTTIALPGSKPRNAGAFLGVFAATFLILWFAAQQRIENIDDYLWASVEVVSGYSEAMLTNSPVAAWDWIAAAVLAFGALVAAVHAGWGSSTTRRLGILGVVALLVVALGKYGFVRHDGAHAGAFFGGVGVIWLALSWRGAARVVPCLALLLSAVSYFPASVEGGSDAIRPRLALDQLRTLLLPEDRDQARDAARSSLRAAYAVDPQIIERIGSAAVDARPWEIGLIWAYDLQWNPLPVIQDYQAYTPRLDQLNAEALTSDQGPRFILRHRGFGSPQLGVDQRFTSFDSPRATMAMLCGFDPVITTDRHQLLERGPNVCEGLRPLETVTAAYGEAVPVPDGRAGEAVLAQIEGAAAEGVERLRTLVFKPAIRYITLDETPYRFVPRNGESGLLLSVPSEADFPAPFALAPNAGAITIDSERGIATSDGPLRIEFYATSVEPRRSGLHTANEASQPPDYFPRK